ncbi:hypothetical protein GYMLUDRAFT_63382 [Collybiopsis luxurians FD-317 M1]|uniref:Uncharacterized protein n=1 Tax=Collybiopsis luxurians FD-317 M1 TaxID=944289 RepID=A0A0D0CGL0_9AGAR|nr:hypothetical protein GYMLUDRAFT_63382 [Collybiopsis luxurians FD-317 M1]
MWCPIMTRAYLAGIGQSLLTLRYINKIEKTGVLNYEKSNLEAHVVSDHDGVLNYEIPNLETHVVSDHDAVIHPTEPTFLQHNMRKVIHQVEKIIPKGKDKKKDKSSKDMVSQTLPAGPASGGDHASVPNVGSDHLQTLSADLLGHFALRDRENRITGLDQATRWLVSHKA